MLWLEQSLTEIDHSRSTSLKLDHEVPISFGRGKTAETWNLKQGTLQRQKATAMDLR